mmetsp:Transcript_32139/g.89992  ORF Transcript_32139/g.89992 Transcript_32139/m.89992 type:complete len:215 (+) Transcript_32139:142-786(+)
MNDADVKKQLDRMKKFILDEAKNKKEEILQSAEEEANKEKDRLVWQGQTAILKDMEKKQKQVEVQKKIRNSHEVNQSRLRVLRAREDAVNQVCRAAHQELFNISKDQGKYKELLKELALQCLFQMEEQNVSLVVRTSDAPLMTTLLNEVKSTYGSKSGKNVNLTMDSKFLDPNSAGGVVAVASGGSVICNNTLEQRLRLAVENQIPEIRAQLFK